MSELTDKILEGVDILIQHRLNKLKLDRTIIATISDDSLSSLGKYKIRYEGNSVDVYALDNCMTEYYTGQQVFILIPENNFSNKKIILSKVSTDNIYDNSKVLTVKDR